MTRPAEAATAPPRHVLYATAARSLSGGSRQLVHNVRGLRELGLRVTVMAPAGSPVARAAADAGAALADWPAGQGLVPNARALHALAQAGGADVIHAFHTHAVKAAVVARLRGLRARVLLNRGVVTAANPLWGAFVRIADGAIANSAAAAATLTARLAPRTRVHVVYNSCPPWPARDAAGPARSGPGTAAPLRVTWVGNAHPAKGFDVLAAVARTVRDTAGPSLARFVALGVGAGDGRRLVDLAGDAVELGGYVDHDEVRRVLDATDVLLLTSQRRESLPNVVTEAFAAGLPVVATDVGGVAELVRDEVNGFVRRPGAVGPLAACVVTLARDAGLRGVMGERNRRLARERLHNAGKAASLLRVYGGEWVVEPPPVRWLDGAAAEPSPAGTQEVPT